MTAYAYTHKTFSLENCGRETAVLSNSNFISKVKQGGDERTTQAVQIARPGVSEEANAVSQMKWNWNNSTVTGALCASIGTFALRRAHYFNAGRGCNEILQESGLSRDKQQGSPS